MFACGCADKNRVRRIVHFPTLSDSDPENQDLVALEAIEIAAEPDLPDELEGPSDPSEWGVPRTFFVVPTPTETFKEQNPAS